MADDPQRRCCIIGLCCPPGSPAQRKAFKAWLVEKLFTADMPGKLYGTERESDVVLDAWLDELWSTDGAA